MVVDWWLLKNGQTKSLIIYVIKQAKAGGPSPHPYVPRGGAAGTKGGKPPTSRGHVKRKKCKGKKGKKGSKDQYDLIVNIDLVRILFAASSSKKLCLVRILTLYAARVAPRGPAQPRAALRCPARPHAAVNGAAQP